jgi:hypothetical protein
VQVVCRAAMEGLLSKTMRLTSKGRANRLKESVMEAGLLAMQP